MPGLIFVAGSNHQSNFPPFDSTNPNSYKLLKLGIPSFDLFLDIVISRNAAAFLNSIWSTLIN
jgi:hypothetical protein